MQRAVLVGVDLAPATPRLKSDGTATRTLWGELAHQLLGAEGYALVANDDQHGTNPGKDTLAELFTRAAPCLVLIDEWVAFARQLYTNSNLPAGSFDANMSFAQSLTQAAMVAPRTQIVVTIPASDGDRSDERTSELGGEGGQVAPSALRQIVGRVETPWRPVDANEGFEIVRRRIFQEITDPDLYTARDAVARSFAKFYQEHRAEFPPPASENDYEERIKRAYPIHPELFDRLYNDWSTLERFQRTRGVLCLVARIVQTLWQHGDQSPLILPSTLPLDEAAVESELNKYLEDNWMPIIEKDIDGARALPRSIDGANASGIGKIHASLRVARTIFWGSAPLVRAQHHGLTGQQIKLGCAVPGESIASFGDALRRLNDQAYHLNADGDRYWYSIQPTVNRMANDLAAGYDVELLDHELEKWLRAKNQGNAGELARAHICQSAGEVADDDRAARLVILSPRFEDTKGNRESKAMHEARHILDYRDISNRRYRNALVFLAPDQPGRDNLRQAMAQSLAWSSVLDRDEELDLSAFQRKTAASKKQHWEQTIALRVSEAYVWLLVPELASGQNVQDVVFTESKLSVNKDISLARNVSARLVKEEMLVTRLAGPNLKRDLLDKIPLWQGNHTSIKKLADDFATYPYLMRLKNTEVLLQAIADGVASVRWGSETFAYADGYDEENERYLGLRAGQSTQILLNDQSLIIRSEVARQQMEADERAAEEARQRRIAAQAASTGSRVNESPGPAPYREQSTGSRSQSTQPEPLIKQEERLPTRYHGSIVLDPRQPGRKIADIADEILAHLASLPDCTVNVTLEIQASDPNGFPVDLQRVIRENATNLKFEKGSGFEEE